METQAEVCYDQRRLEEAKSEALHAVGIFEKLGAGGDAKNTRKLLQKIERAMERGSTPSEPYRLHSHCEFSGPMLFPIPANS